MTMPVAEANPTVRSAANEQQHTKNLVILFAESVSAAAAAGTALRGDRGAGRYNDLAATVIRNHRGQVIKTSGASMMAEFANAADAVRAAVYMERVLTESAEGSPSATSPA